MSTLASTRFPTITAEALAELRARLGRPVRRPEPYIEVATRDAIRHWAHGGPTTLSNLTLLCRRHHRAVHEEGYEVERSADGELIFRNARGREIPDVPESAVLPEDPYERIRAANEAAGLQIHARTALPNWTGDRLNLGWAISVLHPLAAGPVLV